MLPPYDTYRLSVMRQADLQDERNADRAAHWGQRSTIAPERLLRRVMVVTGVGKLPVVARRAWQAR